MGACSELGESIDGALQIVTLCPTMTVSSFSRGPFWQKLLALAPTRSPRDVFKFDQYRTPYT